MGYVEEQIAKLAISKDFNYDVRQLRNVVEKVSKVSTKSQEAFIKRAKLLIKPLALVPEDKWWFGIGEQLKDVELMVTGAIMAIYPRGGGDEYVKSLVLEVAGYQLKNIKKVCDHAVRTWDGSKALPPLSFWLKCITAVKSMNPQKRHYDEDTRPKISKEEQAEVKTMMRELCESFGSKSTKKGAFHNKTTLIRSYGILQELNKGMRQVQTLDGKDYEWVNEWEVGEREVIDHSKVLELFNSGRISEKEAKKIWEQEK
jgi:hypothetical protein